jgi:hypothetical protein
MEYHILQALGCTLYQPRMFILQDTPVRQGHFAAGIISFKTGKYTFYSNKRKSPNDSSGYKRDSSETSDIAEYRAEKGSTRESLVWGLLFLRSIV